jgi:hypothetical protein
MALDALFTDPNYDESKVKLFMELEKERGRRALNYWFLGFLLFITVGALIIAVWSLNRPSTPPNETVGWARTALTTIIGAVVGYVSSNTSRFASPSQDEPREK